MKMVKGVKNQFKFANREYSETADMGEIGGHTPSKQLPTAFMDGPLKPKSCNLEERNKDCLRASRANLL